MRDLIRTRKQALEALKIAKQQLLSFLLRHGLRYERPTYWTKMHWRWINELRKFCYPHQQIAAGNGLGILVKLDHSVDAGID